MIPATASLSRQPGMQVGERVEAVDDPVLAVAAAGGAEDLRAEIAVAVGWSPSGRLGGRGRVGRKQGPDGLPGTFGELVAPDHAAPAGHDLV